jgi:hypothetical protein
MAMPQAAKEALRNELDRIAEITKEFDYIPHRMIADLANSDPVELCWRYVLQPAGAQTGIEKLAANDAIRHSVENVVFRHRIDWFAGDQYRELVRAAERKLRDLGFDPIMQRQTYRWGGGPSGG